ncbi:head decoration protein [Ectothiorhodospira lacustris]|uniref:head decoration protein n=1 Tax=Ectothiorhodospira lacustris TaxID=2899127 RepID=UPI001EE7914B|nr:head decoration protein [Ectothiorhodospira lacustris]MCG5509635.1 head decoration protein [Ectothiorhodospira lacustris]MCG5521570.1 head decoration protein [Ectothiorhodospira lacustris]
MTVIHETAHNGAFLVSEGNGTISRETITALADMLPGTVLASNGAGFLPLDPEADDGSEIAAGVLFGHATEGDQAVAVVRLAEVRGSDLIWPEGITGPEKAQAVADLGALSIVIR